MENSDTFTVDFKLFLNIILSLIWSEKLMGNFIGEFETSTLPTMTMFEGNQYPLIRTIKDINLFNPLYT